MIDPLIIKDNFSLKKDISSLLLKNTSSETEKPKICVCIPTFKRVNTLIETIASIHNQKGFEDYLIIVSDNNPERNDETELFFSGYEGKKTKYYKHTESLGMFGNINRCFELSESEYTVIVHDDDLLLPHFFQIVYYTMTKYRNIDILYPNSVWWKSESEPCPVEQLEAKTYIYKNTLPDCALTCPHPPTGVIFKTDSIVRIGGFDVESYPSSDYYFNCKSFQLLNVYTMHQPLYVYRWGINATLKLETILGFIEKDIPLKNYLISRCFFLRPFRKQVMILYSEYKKQQLQSHPEYDISHNESLLLYSRNYEIKQANFFNNVYTIWRGFQHFLGRKTININKMLKMNKFLK